MFFKKKEKKAIVPNSGSVTLSLFDPSGGDTTELALKLAKKHTADGLKTIIVELPCIGLPRLSIHMEDAVNLEKEKSIDSLLINFERNELKAMEHYISQVDGIDCIASHPLNGTDVPVFIKLTNAETLLKTPVHLMQELSDYNLIIFALQGQLFHPMTLVTLRHSDGIVMTIPSISAMHITMSTFKKMPTYAIKENIKIHSSLGLDVDKSILNDKELFSFISTLEQRKSVALDSFENKNFSTHLGIINPAEYISYQVQRQPNEREFDKKDSEMIEQLIMHTRAFLKKQHPTDFINSFIDEKKRFLVCQIIADYIREQTAYQFSGNLDLDDVIKAVQTEITQMGPLQEALDDPLTTSIEINSPGESVSEINRVSQVDPRIKFRDTEHIYQIINKMLFPMGKSLTANEPVIDSQYGGFRINVVADRSKGGLTTDSPVISIRKFPPDVYSSADCIRYGNITEEIDQFFTDVYPVGPSTMIGGSVNSGKTSQLIRIPLYLDPLTRLLTIEDSEEMMLKKKIAYQNYPNIVSFVVKEHENVRRRYSIAKITKVTLRQNPDWIIIGEIRDAEAASEALVAANTGNVVALSIHANDVRMTAVRMVQMAGDTPYVATKVGESFDLVIYQENINGVRVLTDVCELLGFDEHAQPMLNPIFKYNFLTAKHERVGSLIKLKDRLIKKGASVAVINRWCEEKIKEVTAS